MVFPGFSLPCPYYVCFFTVDLHLHLYVCIWQMSHQRDAPCWRWSGGQWMQPQHETWKWASWCTSSPPELRVCNGIKHSQCGLWNTGGTVQGFTSHRSLATLHLVWCTMQIWCMSYLKHFLAIIHHTKKHNPHKQWHEEQISISPSQLQGTDGPRYLLILRSTNFLIKPFWLLKKYTNSLKSKQIHLSPIFKVIWNILTSLRFLLSAV